MTVPVIRGVGAWATSVSAITPAYPAGTAAGDLALMFTEVMGGSGEPALTCSEWTELLSINWGDGAATAMTRLTVLQRIVSDPGTDNRLTNDVGNHQSARIVTVETGTFNASTPINVTNTGTATGVTAVSVPGADTTVADCLCFAAATGSQPDTDTAGTEFGAATNASLTTLTERGNESSSAGNGGSLWIVSGEKAAAGTVSATTCTAATSANRAYGFIAVQPPASAVADPYPYVGGGYYPHQG